MTGHETNKVEGINSYELAGGGIRLIVASTITKASVQF